MTKKPNKENRKTISNWNPADNIPACIVIICMLTIGIIFLFWTTKDKAIQDTVQNTECLEEYYSAPKAISRIRLKYLKIETEKGYETRADSCDEINIGDKIEFSPEKKLFRKNTVYVFIRKIN